MIKEKIKNLKKYRFTIFGVMFFGFLFIFSPLNFANASVDSAIGIVLGWVIYPILFFVGKITTWFIDLLVTIAQYSNIIDAEPVKVGWKIVRDLCNMFFILILLVIAFATILRIESYNVKKTLPKLLIMAVLINFSKTICGLIIDFAQVIMLTFINGFANARNNLLVSLGVDSFMSSALWSPLKNTITFGSIDTASSLIASLIFFLVTLVVMVVMTAVLMIRIVMLWIYTLLSPIAFLASSFPAGQKYSSQWWSEFTSYVITGPVLAFFIWLALKTADKVQGLTLKAGLTDADPQCMGALISIMCGTKFQTFIITTGILIGGLIITQKVGGIAGSVAGKGIGVMQKGGKFMRDRTLRKLGDITGINAGRQYIKLRSEAKEQIRTDKLNQAAGKMASAIGKTKQVTIGKLSGAASNQWNRMIGGNKAAEIRKDIEKDKGYKDDLESRKGLGYDKFVQKALNDKKLFVDAKNKKTYKRTDDGSWEETSMLSGAKNKINESDVIKNMASHFDKLIPSEVKEIDKKIIQKEGQAEKLEKRRDLLNTAAKIGMGTIGAAGAIAGGVATGGLGLLGAGSLLAAGGAAGYKGMSKLGSVMKEAGDLDLKLASKYRVEKSSKKQDDYKDESNEKVLNDIDNGKNEYDRTAAAMEALSRKLLSLEDAIKVSSKIQKEMGGKNKKTGDWNDRKMGTRVEALLEKNYAGATRVFQDLKGTDADKATKAKNTIKDRWSDGTYNLKDTDTGSIKSSIDEMVTGVSTATFASQWKNLSDEKKRQLKDMLKSSDRYEAKEKLAHVTNIDNAFGAAPNTDKTKFAQSLSLSQIKDVLEDSNDPAKWQALVKAINGKKENISSNVWVTLNNGSPVSNGLKKSLGLENQT